MSTKFSLEVIDNEGPNTLRQHLLEELPKVKSADFAVAFFTDAGLSGLHSALATAARQGRVRLLTGLYQGVTEPDALRWALDLQAKNRGKFQARLSPQLRFHWKLYILRYSHKTVTIVGSANFTGDGLTKRGEFCLVTTFRSPSGTLSHIEQSFEAAWNENNKSLHEDQIQEYARQRGKTIRPVPTFNVKKIVGVGQPSIETSLGREYWRDSVSDYVQPATNQAVCEETNWDRKGYEWYAIGNHSIKSGDRVLLFDFTIRKLYVVEVKSSTRLSRHTPDGRFFIAYKRVRRISEQAITAALWRRLREEGLIKKKDDVYIRRPLHPGEWTHFLRVLGE